jgi:hypothetical protein
MTAYLMTRVTASNLTDADINRARAAALIDRATYEAALYGDPDARQQVATAINDRNRRQFIEEVTP